MNKKISVASFDAGGAYFLSYYLKYNKMKFKSYIAGPALNIYKSIFKSLKNSKKEFFDSDVIISSTGSTNFEKKIIKESKIKKIYTIAILDHWVNYVNRFKLKNTIYIPDEIWVFDIYAYRIAKKIFSKKQCKIYLKKNFYFVDLRNSFKKSLNKKQKIIGICLFSSPNISSKKNALKHIINYIESRFKNKNYKIILRPHPKEKINKLIQLTKGFKKLKISKNSIQKDLINSSYAYGSNSMGLVIADKIFRCKAFNLHIFKGFKNILPYKSIKQIKLF